MLLMLRLMFVITSWFVCATSAIALEVAKEFSADAVQVAPSRPAFEARMYVSKEAVRTESTLQGQRVIEIIFPKKMRQLLIIPANKVYLEQTGQISAAANRSKSQSKNPCEGMPGTTCKKIGSETIEGRAVEKWEFITSRSGQNQRSLHWIDSERRMPLREFFPDGTVSELHLLQKEKINGRQTEKWEMQITRANGEQIKSLQWYDPELQIAIREQMPGGYVRELKNIKIGQQPKKLFEVPAGYQKVDQLPPSFRPARAPSGMN